MKRFLLKLNQVLSGLYSESLRAISPIVIERCYGGFWNYRSFLLSLNKCGNKTQQLIYRHYLNRYGCFVGLNTKIESPPCLPHNLHGIFIAEGSSIGKDVTLYQHVTIGGNQLKGSKNFGSPIIEDGVLIGAGAKIIGKITIGRNSRIGAGCVVSRDVPPNAVVVMPQALCIEKAGELENIFVPRNNSLLRV